jgi:hypothetical protein
MVVHEGEEEESKVQDGMVSTRHTIPRDKGIPEDDLV